MVCLLTGALKIVKSLSSIVKVFVLIYFLLRKNKSLDLKFARLASEFWLKTSEPVIHKQKSMFYFVLFEGEKLCIFYIWENSNYDQCL